MSHDGQFPSSVLSGFSESVLTTSRLSHTSNVWPLFTCCTGSTLSVFTECVFSIMCMATADLGALDPRLSPKLREAESLTCSWNLVVMSRLFLLCRLRPSRYNLCFICRFFLFLMDPFRGESVMSLLVPLLCFYFMKIIGHRYTYPFCLISRLVGRIMLYVGSSIFVLVSTLIDFSILVCLYPFFSAPWRIPTCSSCQNLVG